MFILKMPVLKVSDLLEVVVKHYAPKYKRKPEEIERKVIGIRAGEKLYEELMTESEALGAYETDNMFIVPSISPTYEEDIKAKCPGIRKTSVAKYSSADAKMLSVDEIEALFKKMSVI